MKQTITKLLGGALFVLLFLVFSIPVHAIDIAVDMTTGSWVNDQVKNDAKTGIYFKVEGSTVTTQAVQEGSTFHFQTQRWNDNNHGWVRSVITITVDCPVKIGIGNCHFNGNFNGSISDGVNTKNFTTADNCYNHSTGDNVTYVYFKENGSKTLTITCPTYLPFFSIKSVNPAELPEERTISFDKGEGEGVVPASRTIDAGSIITLPKNRTLFVEGKTLTGWSDGVNTYAPNSSFTMPNANTTLTAVYTTNTVNLSDRTETVTITYDLGGTNENNKYSVAKDATGFMVTQASVNGTTIDVKADILAKGKNFETNNSGWHFIGKDTEVTVPSGKGATFSVFQHNTTSLLLDENSFTIPGNDKDATCTATSSNTTAVIKQGNDDYWRTLTITLQAPQTVNVPITSALYGTYYNGEMALTLPANLQAATIDGEAGGTLTLNYQYSEGDVIPKATPVLLKATAADTYILTEKIGDVTPAPAGNLLYGSDEATTTTGGGAGAKYYALQYGLEAKSDVLGFYWVNADGAAFMSGAHKAWLALPAATPANFFALDDETTGIKAVETSPVYAGKYYDLQGRQVAQPTKGLYIVNGKKVVIK